MTSPPQSTKRNFAVFISEEAFEDHFEHKLGKDWNEDHLKTVFMDEYYSNNKLHGWTIENWIKSFVELEPNDIDHGIFVCLLPEGTSNKVGRMIAGCLGFDADYVSEGTYQLVILL